MADENNPLTRRRAIGLGAGILGAAGLGALPALTGDPSARKADDAPMNSAPAKLPVVYLPHGGGPWPFVELGFDKAEMQALADYLGALGTNLPSRPRAILSVSAHWEAPVPTVMTAAQPPMLYDYYGFPPEAYRLSWPAPGAPEVAARIQELLGKAGIASATDDSRGFDHGTFVPLMLSFPEAKIPTLQLSLRQGLDPEQHLAMGRALAPLREEGVFIVGSGMSFHNMRAFGDPRRAASLSADFGAWLVETAAASPSERERRLGSWSAAPGARLAHPREEHLLPLMVVAGAAGTDPGRVAFDGAVMGARVSAVHFG
ncbi:MAG: class III extradiol ring-cleavage dioxygenase [Myxococcota bacterium]